MKVSEYIPFYGLLFNDTYQTGINGKPITVNEMFENHGDFELTDFHLVQLYTFDLCSLYNALQDEYFTPTTVAEYIRLLFDEYRTNGGNPLEWLHKTFEVVNMNPQNFRVELRTSIEKTLLELIETWDKIQFDHLYYTINPEAIAPFLHSETKTEQEIPKTFEELFYNPQHAEPCLKILSELQPPVIDAINNYIGKAKGVFPLWVKVLKNYKPEPLIKHFKDTVYKDLLNQKVKGLNLSKDASEFRKQYKRLETDKIEIDIKAILSQYSQRGKLGK